MNNLKNLRTALQTLATCPTCGKSRMLVATGFRGHGTGRHGSSYYSATGYEKPTLETHCTCPGGPCDQAGLLPKGKTELCDCKQPVIVVSNGRRYCALCKKSPRAHENRDFSAVLVGPDLVEIQEIGDTYRMSRSDVETAIENVKANRHKYTDIAYRHRLHFFEEILGVFEPKES